MSPSTGAEPGSAIHPEPTEEEAAAIAAALSTVWLRPRVVAADPAPPATHWRFSGRWWSAQPWSRPGSGTSW